MITTISIIFQVLRAKASRDLGELGRFQTSWTIEW